ncbi:hypothetical protein ABE61_18565 [Lysinibacillus sphaericus]|nr:hypothetical protein [Lysinibacillus sphaericus]MBG9479632.1 hypothetical protein [Lysinibacillus sphaericus]MBG9593886.1 hypothetical protein [Lysinibacillus sphaericus]
MHGTMIVITYPELAREEVQRLNKQCIAIESFDLLDDILFDDRNILLNQLTKIDGAIYIDIEGRCHSIGVILDGEASEDGDSSRGARYNSALRYRNRNNLKDQCVIIVISEDGMINIIGKQKIDSKKEIYELKIKLKEGNFDEVLKRVEELIGDEKYNIDYLFIKAEVLVKNNDYGSAIDVYNKILGIEPDQERAYNLRGICYALDKQFEIALEDFNKAIKLKPFNPSYYYNRGLANHNINNLELALNDYLKSIDISPSYTNVYDKYIDVCIKLNNFDNTLEILNNAIK